jgi:hypothetical protein
MSKRGKLLLQLDFKVLETMDLSAKDFAKAVREETSTFFMLLGNLLMKKVHQKGYTFFTYEVTGYDCSEDLSKVMENCILYVPELGDDERFGRRVFYRIVSYLIPDWYSCSIRVFNFGHGVLITLAEGDKVIKHIKVTPIGLKTFEGRKKLCIKELL